MAVNDFAVIGLNDLGRGLALNMKSRHYSVAVYDENVEGAFKFANDCASRVKSYREFKSLIHSLSVPRKIFLSVNADKIDDILAPMLQYLNKSDTIIDLSDSHYEDVKKRAQELSPKSIRYLDAAVTGPVEEIESGTGMIVGGEDDAFNACSRILRQMSREFKGFASCIHSGAWGTGHYTKIVHDSIEASIMQIIADAYFILRTLGGMKCNEIASAFAFINEEVNLYLLGIAAVILDQMDEEIQEPIIDFIADSASSCTSSDLFLKESQKNNSPQLMAAQAQGMRLLSRLKEQRKLASKRLYAPVVRYDSGSIRLLDIVKDTMRASLIIAYTQGFDLLGVEIESGEWNYGQDEIARVWSGASTIRSDYLGRAHTAFNKNDALANLMHDEYFSNQLKSVQRGFRETVMLAAKHGIPTPSFMSALSYYDSIRMEKLPANLIQSQLNFMRRDTVKRYDMEGNFNVDWIVDDKVKNKKSPS
jgi:6-phosphogluconate dehydrogenase